MPHSTAQFRRSLSASGTAWAYTLLAWDQFIGSDNVGRVPIERKLARVPAPRVFPREPKDLLQANVTIDHRFRSQKRENREKQITKTEREKEGKRDIEKERKSEKRNPKERKREREREGEKERKGKPREKAENER